MVGTATFIRARRRMPARLAARSAPGRTVGRAALVVIAIAVAMPAAMLSAQVPPPLAIEESDTATLPAPSPQWVLLSRSLVDGASIVDGSGKLRGTLQHAPLSNVAMDPNGRYYYVAETIWTRRTRGTRQDLLVVRDVRSLKIVREIPLPGRQIITYRKNTLSISSDGRKAYVFNMDPASSITTVDLVTGKVMQTIEVPGCGQSFAVATDAVASLCSDGTVAMARLAGRRTTITHSNVFFDAETDPVFENSVIDADTGKATFVSYTGLVYTSAPGDPLSIGQPWSVQEAAGLRRADAAAPLVNWRPGGRQPVAVHQASGRLFVLMHTGEHWTQKQPGTELWVLDMARHALIGRHVLDAAAEGIEVSQNAKPLLFVSEASGRLTAFDADQMTVKWTLPDVGSGIMTTTRH